MDGSISKLKSEGVVVAAVTEPAGEGLDGTGGGILLHEPRQAIRTGAPQSKPQDVLESSCDNHGKQAWIS